MGEVVIAHVDARHGDGVLAAGDEVARTVGAREHEGQRTGPRLLCERPSYAVNIPAIIAAAAATGTIIEINASPWRLDMDWRWWQLAKEKGVKTSINPDAHSTRGLQDLFFGIRSARKGWLTPEQVLNTRPLPEVLRWLGR